MEMTTVTRSVLATNEMQQRGVRRPRATERRQTLVWRARGGVWRVLLSVGLSMLLISQAMGAGKPLKVFVLAGQSNMQGHAQQRTFVHVGRDPRTAPLLEAMQASDGKARISRDVWISYLSANGEKHGQLTVGFGADDSKIGPELMFGIAVQKQLQEPILLIKTAWGGKSLHTDFRPPSAGPYVFGDAQLERMKAQGKDIAAVKADKVRATGHYYRLMLAHVKQVLENIARVYPNYDADAGYELGGFIWFQGWNDMVDSGTYPQRGQPGGYDQYSHVLEHLIRDVRRELATPQLPFVIGVIGVGGPVEKYLPAQQRYRAIHQSFRSAMAAPAAVPELERNVAAVLTEKYWDMELVALRARDAEVRQKVKQLRAAGKVSRQDERATLEKYRAEALSEREREILATAVSNAEYHYLGSAKIMAQIGAGFAEAVLALPGK